MPMTSRPLYILCSHQDDSTTHEPIITKLRLVSQAKHAFSNTQCAINVSTSSSRRTCQLSSCRATIPSGNLSRRY
ncbi:hypothetical protein BGW80DRAFT_1331889, partial [Lactifluus volemus]